MVLQTNDMRLLRATLLIGRSRIFERSKATDINLQWKTPQQGQTVVNENANKDSDVFNTQGT